MVEKYQGQNFWLFWDFLCSFDYLYHFSNIEKLIVIPDYVAIKHTVALETK